MSLTRTISHSIYRILTSSRNFSHIADIPSKSVEMTSIGHTTTPSQVQMVSENNLQQIYSEAENHKEIIEQFAEKSDESFQLDNVHPPLSMKMIEEARRLKAETGKATFRKIAYNEGELDNSNLDEPPSTSNPHPFDSSTIPPVHSNSLVPFVNHSPVLRLLVDIGVDLAEIESTTTVGRYLLRLQMSDVRDKVKLMQEGIGFENEEIGKYLTKNPFFLIQDVNDMQTRINYLEMKKFTKPERKKIIKEYRYWLNCNVELIDTRLGWIQKHFKLTAKLTRQIIVKEPRIIMFGTGPLERMLKLMTKELNFDQNQLKTLISEDPRLFMMDSKLVSKTYRFVRDIMKINNETIVEHPFILRCSLSAIKSRHDFLKKRGRANYQLSTRKENVKDPSEVQENETKEDNSNVELVSLEHFLLPSDAGFSMLAAKTYPVAYDKFLRNS